MQGSLFPVHSNTSIGAATSPALPLPYEIGRGKGELLFRVPLLPMGARLHRHARLERGVLGQSPLTTQVFG
jgi:hypothetical protein